MHHDLHHIPLAQLKVSKLNARRHGAKEIASLTASIAAIGMLQPLLVRRQGDGFAIVAGQRRYLAAKALDAVGDDTVSVLHEWRVIPSNNSLVEFSAIASRRNRRRVGQGWINQRRGL